MIPERLTKLRYVYAGTAAIFPSHVAIVLCNISIFLETLLFNIAGNKIISQDAYTVYWWDKSDVLTAPLILKCFHAKIIFSNKVAKLNTHT